MSPAGPEVLALQQRGAATRERLAVADGGIAVHGSPSIPADPASHGCARVSGAAVDTLGETGVAALGTEVRVY